jgi:hypothetical protein
MSSFPDVASYRNGCLACQLVYRVGTSGCTCVGTPARSLPPSSWQPQAPAISSSAQNCSCPSLLPTPAYLPLAPSVRKIPNFSLLAVLTSSHLLAPARKIYIPFIFLLRRGPFGYLPLDCSPPGSSFLPAIFVSKAFWTANEERTKRLSKKKSGRSYWSWPVFSETSWPVTYGLWADPPAWPI